MIPHSQPWISEAETIAVQSVLSSAMLSRAGEIEKLETEFAAFLNKKYALFTGNGSQAQYLILQALGVGPGDEVIVPVYVCDKVATVIKMLGAKPVLCDISADWVVDTPQIIPFISASTRAVILPHVNGINAWDESFANIGIPVIEDICQCLDQKNSKNAAGSNSDFAFTSFHGTKCLGAGEGGMLFVNDPGVFNQIIKLKKQNPLLTSGTEMAAAMVRSQLGRWDEILEKRKEIAHIYSENIPENLTGKFLALGDKAMFFRYLLTSDKEFNSIRQAFFSHQIHVRQGVDTLIHRDYGLDDLNFPNALTCFQTTVSIPALPQLSMSQVQYVAEITNRLFSEGKI